MADAALPRRRMRADEFLAWAASLPEGAPRHELVAGEVVAMAPERAAHAQAKALAWQALHQGARERGLPCQAFPDGMAVRVDDAVVYEPDALLRCGEPLADDALELSDPVVVVEVVSPSSARRDAGAKLGDYFRLASVRHYLILRTEDRTVIHHSRAGADGPILTRIARAGATLRLDPPGVALEVAGLFA